MVLVTPEGQTTGDGDGNTGVGDANAGDGPGNKEQEKELDEELDEQGLVQVVREVEELGVVREQVS